jgi:hypothetical protein
MRTWVWIAVVVFGLGGSATAQPRRGPGPGAAPAGVAERREQIKKRIRAMRAYTLTEELALDEPTAAKLFPVLARYDDETDKLLEKRVEVQRRLRRADTLRDARAIDRLIDEAIANQRGFWDLEDRRLAELRKILTPVQSAKLLVVLPALERRIQNQLRKVIARGQPAPAPAPAGPAPSTADDTDDDQEPDEVAVPPRKPLRPRREAPLAPRDRSSNAPGNTPPCDPSAGPCR